MIYLVIHEFTRPDGKRDFRALTTVHRSEIAAQTAATNAAVLTKRRAWALEFPDPPMLELATSAEILAFKKDG